MLFRKNNADAIASGRAEILEGNVAALPWPDGRFSAGASANMFFFVPEPQKALFATADPTDSPAEFFSLPGAISDNVDSHDLHTKNPLDSMLHIDLVGGGVNAESHLIPQSLHPRGFF